MKIKKGDTIEIITGKNKGERAPVDKVLQKDGKVKVVVSGKNLATKHQKDTQSQGRGGKIGGRIEITVPLDISNIMLVCPKCDLKTRVGFDVSGESKQRICKKCQKTI